MESADPFLSIEGPPHRFDRFIAGSLLAWVEIPVPDSSCSISAIFFPLPSRSIHESKNARSISRAKINRSVAGEIDRFRPRSETDTRVFVYARPWSRSIDNLSAIRLNLATRSCRMRVHASRLNDLTRRSFVGLEARYALSWQFPGY